jgi:hypothetical protein
LSLETAPGRFWRKPVTASPLSLFVIGIEYFRFLSVYT